MWGGFRTRTRTGHRYDLRPSPRYAAACGRGWGGRRGAWRVWHGRAGAGGVGMAQVGRGVRHGHVVGRSRRVVWAYPRGGRGG